MANKAMKERHWDRIATVTGHQFDVESENFLLRNIMEAPLLANKEDIEVSNSHVMHSHYMSRSNSVKSAEESCSGWQRCGNFPSVPQSAEKSGPQFKFSSGWFRKELLNCSYWSDHVGRDPLNFNDTTYKTRAQRNRIVFIVI